MDILKDWFTTFGMILIKPLPQTFVKESAKAKGKLPGIVGWLIFITTLESIYYFTFRRFFSLALLLESVLLLPVVFLLFVFCVYKFCQKLTGRKKDYYSELLYLIVGICVPFSIISFGVAYIPGIIGYILGWITSIYPYILIIIAVKAITRIKIWQSFIVCSLSLIVAMIGFVCILFFFQGLMTTMPRVFN